MVECDICCGFVRSVATSDAASLLVLLRSSSSDPFLDGLRSCLIASRNLVRDRRVKLLSWRFTTFTFTLSVVFTTMLDARKCCKNQVKLQSNNIGLHYLPLVAASWIRSASCGLAVCNVFARTKRGLATGTWTEDSPVARGASFFCCCTASFRQVSTRGLTSFRVFVNNTLAFFSGLLIV